MQVTESRKKKHLMLTVVHSVDAFCSPSYLTHSDFCPCYCSSVLSSGLRWFSAHCMWSTCRLQSFCRQALWPTFRLKGALWIVYYYISLSCCLTLMSKFLVLNLILYSFPLELCSSLNTVWLFFGFILLWRPDHIYFVHYFILNCPSLIALCSWPF